MTERIPKPNKPFWTADCETDPFDGVTLPKPFIWGVYNGYDDEYHEFLETAAFIEFVRDKRVILYAHNGGKFDWHFITRFMLDGSEPLIINGRLAKFFIGECEFRDSWNLIAQPLRNFLKEDFDYDKMHRAVRHLHMDEISKYLESDCVNLWEVLQQFRETYGLHLTQAGAAMQIWQHDFMDKGKYPGRWRQKKDDFLKLRPYYYGGRVQCFRSGDFERKAISVDINSAYPYAMTFDHAFMRPTVVGDGTPPEKFGPWERLFFDVRGVARGCFPYRDSRQKTYYPADDVRRTYRVTGWELVAAIETGTLDDWEILSYIGCESTVNFSNYIDYFWSERLGYKERLHADPNDYVAKWRQHFCKIFMNALYGKFGADIERYKRHFFYSLEHFERLKLDGLRDNDDWFEFNEWVVLRRLKDESSEQRYYNVGTAASITGFVRAMLWRAICTAAIQPLYCDTDSFCAGGIKKDAIALGNELGQWEIEGRYDRVAIAGKKLYAYRFAERNADGSERWKSRSKGVKFGHEQILRVCAGERVIYDPQAPSFKVRGDGPEFIRREIAMTANDATTVPRERDPEFIMEK